MGNFSKRLKLPSHNDSDPLKEVAGQFDVANVRWVILRVDVVVGSTGEYLIPPQTKKEADRAKNKAISTIGIRRQYELSHPTRRRQNHWHAKCRI